MKSDKMSKIEKYHVEEIILILLILSSDLSKYHDDELSSFSEDIEGRIEVLFTKDFLQSLNKKIALTEDIVSELENLKALVINLYESQWIKKLIEPSNRKVELIRLKAHQVLDDLNITYTDPKEFAEEHLDVNW